MSTNKNWLIDDDEDEDVIPDFNGVGDEVLVEIASDDPTVTSYSSPMKGKAKDVVIDNKVYKSNQFKKGERFGKAKKSVGIAEGMQLTNESHGKALRSPKSMQEFKAWARSYGITRIMNIMEGLNDADFLKVFSVYAPYLMPRIAAVENKSTDDKPVVGKEVQMHTITVKDMRTGKTIVIKDE